MVNWEDIRQRLDTMTPVKGGFSQAQRGVMTVPDDTSNGTPIFVKIGTDELSKEWAQKEIEVYRYLDSQAYSSIPKLLATDPEQTAFALEALTAEDGWDWTDTWTIVRLEATLSAMDQLAELKPQQQVWMSSGQLALDESRDGWALLQQSAELQQTLLDKLRANDYSKLAGSLNFGNEFERSSTFVFRSDTLVHYDVRADNCAWNPAKNQVKLVDWNWTQYGDTRIDCAATLTHVQKAGLDIRQSHANRLDSDALQWMAGFWFKAAASPIWQGGPEHLRDFQLVSGVTALRLSSLL